MTSQHSPGPWRWAGSEDGGDVRLIRSETHPILVGRCTNDANDAWVHYFEEADAALIAAAPELLEALKGALGAFTCNDCVDWGAYEALIARIERK